MKKSRLEKKRYPKLWLGSKRFCALKLMNERRRTNNIDMKPQAASIAFKKQRRRQDRRTQRKMRDSKRDFQMARSVVLDQYHRCILTLLFSVSKVSTNS